MTQSQTEFLERTGSTAVQTDENKELAAIKGKMFLAKQFPRNQEQAISNILFACNKLKLAETAIYSFKRGDSEVRGPSIRLAEAVAQNWGNFLCGVKEIERFDGKALVSSYAWDLETNFQDEKVFEVPLVRTTKNGTFPLTNERDIYEMIANQAARRKRSCIMAVVPQYIFELAMEACEKTLLDNVNENGGSLEEKRKEMLEAFQKLADWITEETIAGLFGKKFEAIEPKDIVKLQHLFCSIRDGFVSAEKAFGKASPEELAQPSIEEQAELAAVVENAKKGKAKIDVIAEDSPAADGQ